jgi:hypothetical protein
MAEASGLGHWQCNYERSASGKSSVVQCAVGHARFNDNATGLTGWQVRLIRATPLWAYLAIWLVGVALIARNGSLV